MFRKMSSKPGPSFFTELGKEFAVYFLRIAELLGAFLKKYPRQVYIAMLICIILSAALAFTVMRIDSNQGASIVPVGRAALKKETSGLFTSSSLLKEVLELQSRINQTLQKDSLSATDSVLVKEAFKRLETINHQLNPKK